MTRKIEKNNIALFILIFLCGFAFGQLLLKSFTKLTLSDFHVYYYITKVVMKYGMHPYSNFTPIYPYYFPPASLIIFWPLTLMPFYMAKIIFTLFNGFLLILSIFLINKMLIRKIDIRFWLLLLLSLLFYPLRFTFTDGQFNIVMLAIFTLGLYSLYKNKNVLGGVSLGVGVVTKISPAIILLYGILRKKFKLVLVSGLTVIALSLLAEQFVKKDINYYYAKFIVKDVSSQSSGSDSTDQSLLGLIKRVSRDEKLEITPVQQSLISYLIVGISGLLFFIIDLKTKKGKYTLFIDYFILTTIGVIGTGLAWYHQYAILLLPLLGTAVLIFTHFDKKFKKERLIYIVGITLVYLSWFANLRSKNYFPKNYYQFVMFYGGVLLLIGLYVLKFNQKWLSDTDQAEFFDIKMREKFVIMAFLASVLIGFKPLSFSENLKKGRDEARVSALDYMSEVLISKKVNFKSEESNSFLLSNRVGKGYIRFDKGEDSKVLDKMYILYDDPINNEDYNFVFKSSGGSDFNLSAKMESKRYKEMYGDFYVRRNENISDIVN